MIPSAEKLGYHSPVSPPSLLAGEFISRLDNYVAQAGDVRARNLLWVRIFETIKQLRLALLETFGQRE